MHMGFVHTHRVAVSIVFLLLIGGLLRVYSPVAERVEQRTVVPAASQVAYPYAGNHVVVFLDDMRVELRDGTTTLESMKIVTIGKPGSYYETIGGAYNNDYKIKNHFSSMGKVFLPWSVHLFGNFFIHGIPYYPNGEKVSSSYSGGCIRLQDEDAKRLYEFVTSGMPIVVVKHDVREFAPIATSTNRFSSIEMTRYMATLVSLEVLKQDEQIQGEDGLETTRRKLIPRLINEKDDAVIQEISKSVGNAVFLDYMHKKAVSLGLTNTTFTTIDGAATTSDEDYARLVHYVADYKSYLIGIASTTPLFSQ